MANYLKYIYQALQY